MNFNSKSDKVSTIFAIIIFTLCLVLPIILSITLYKKFGYLMKPLVRAKWGILFEELKLLNEFFWGMLTIGLNVFFV